MCGIAGYLSSRSLDGSAMVRSLKHRGPNDEGQFEKVIGDKKLFLGHTRLSILDLSERGHQPMQDRSGRYTVVYNGEIYNYRELRKTFLPDLELRSGTDTEVILEMWAKMGPKALDNFNGAFAFALFDQEEGKLFLVRDRVGIKPFYYHLENEELIFASEIKALLAAGLNPELAEDQLQAYFTFKYSPKNDTLFKGVQRLAPGNYLEFDLDKGELNEQTYWSPKVNAKITDLDYSAAKEELFHRMSKAVDARLIADVPVSTFLSGGLDSSIIAWHLRDKRHIKHYCAGKSAEDLKTEGSTDDLHYAKKLAEEWQLDLQEVPIGTPELTLEMVRRTVRFSDDLIADASHIPSYLINGIAAKESRVVLSGMGADELFLGYAGHMITLLSMYMDKFPNFISSSTASIFGGLDPGRGKFKAFKRYLYKMGKYYLRGPERYGMFSIVGDFDRSASIIDADPAPMVEMLASYFKDSDDPFDGLKQFELENFLVKNLHYMDRMSMAHGVESRVPFLDHNVVEFAWSIKREFKLAKVNYSKRILKDTYQQHLPDYILKRRKAGFGMPLRSIFSDPKNIDALLDLELFGDLPKFSIQAINIARENHLNGSEDNSALLYALISFQEWYKEFIG